MVSSELMALNARADAGRFWPEIHFYDRAATTLTRLLDIDARVRFCPLDERRYLRANHWLDRCCLTFFSQYPTGVGIECGAGLSTRFHRLSEQHEWPQFSWVDIDSEESMVLKSRAMPLIDNYRLISTTDTAENLVDTIHWNKSTPLVLVIDGLSHRVNAEHIKQLLQAILASKYELTPVCLFAAFEASTPWYKKIMGALGLPVLAPYQRLFSGLGGSVSHLKYFGRNIQSRKEMVMGLGLYFE